MGIRRRDLLKTGSCLSVPAIAGCSEVSSEESTESTDTPSTPDALDEADYTLSPDHTVAEWEGPLELNADQPYWKKKINPPDTAETITSFNRCFVLECEATLPPFSDEEVNVFLVSDNDLEALDSATDLMSCPSLSGHKIGPLCKTNNRYLEETDVSGEVLTLNEDDDGYVRHLLPNKQFWLVVDGTNALGGRTMSADEEANVPDIELDVKIRYLENSFADVEGKVHDEIEGWFSAIHEQSAEETKGTVQEFAQEICDLDQAGALSNESIGDFADDVTRIEEYSGFIEDFLIAIKTHYQMDLPDDFMSKLRNSLNWGSTALPIIGSIMTTAEKACDLATIDSNSSDSEVVEKAEALLLSVGGLVIQIKFWKFGVAFRVKKSVVQTAETFVLGYVRQVAGLRMFAYILKQLTIEVADGIVNVIREFAELIVEEITDRLIDEEDERLLDNLALSDDDGWDDLEELIKGDCTCDDLYLYNVCTVTTLSEG